MSAYSQQGAPWVGELGRRVGVEERVLPRPVCLPLVELSGKEFKTS